VTEEQQKLKTFLDRKVQEYNRPAFINNDPVVIPHQYTEQQDIEIAAFFAATFAWGNRTTIINKGRQLMDLMDNSPYQFILLHKERQLKRFEDFRHRTFTTTDLLYFISFLRQHYHNHKSLEDAFLSEELKSGMPRCAEPMELRLNHFYKTFFSMEHVPSRTRKHVAAPAKNSACKRLNMFLRWMVRKDRNGVDFGLWSRIKPAELICPLDLHVARVAKRFHLITRPNADWQSALELTTQLRMFDPKDPVKYDFALFALGVNEKF
jgi:uncharacterized protein (TIGR02757 family)